MKQILVKKGQVFEASFPEPPIKDDAVKIKVLYSCISAGTELSNISSTGKSILQRVAEKPEIIGRAFNKISKMGLQSYWDSVQTELQQALPSGYSLAGKVIEVGKNITNFKVGDLVAAAGGIVASHAEIAVVPKNLVVAIPQNVTPKHASTVAIGSIALQGIRRANLSFGSNVAVLGTGLLGLLTIQLLKANGMNVLAIDIDEQRLQFAKKCGADLTMSANSETLVSNSIAWSDGYGVDATIITASTDSNTPLSQAFKICRKKGTVVLVGVTGMTIDRKDIYEKELDFFISTSYGPGRYDDKYEKDGIDYPYGYVRWTENRNMQAYLNAIANESIDLSYITQADYSLADAKQAFATLKSPNAPLLSFFKYDSEKSSTINSELDQTTFHSKTSSKFPLKTAVIGTGSFASNMTIPILKSLNKEFEVDVLVNQTPFKAQNLATKFNVPNIETSVDDLIKNHECDVVFITTRHSTHTDIVLKCLEAGIHVFVEKPLSINENELNRIKNFYSNSNGKTPILTVGYNRRFSPFIQEIKTAVDQRINPLMMTYRVNAGFRAADHWTHKDGGRIIGEACHFIDTFSFLVDDTPKSVSIDSVSANKKGVSGDDNKIITISYNDGSICSLIYTGQGNEALPKERLEVFFDQKSIVLDDYKILSGFGVRLNHAKGSGDKGHKAIIKAFSESIKTGDSWPIELESMIETTKLTFIGGNR